jgi:hypothetical protein
MPIIETGKPAPHHIFNNSDDAREAIRAGIEYLIEVDAYTAEDMSAFTEDEITSYAE